MALPRSTQHTLAWDQRSGAAVTPRCEWGRWHQFAPAKRLQAQCKYCIYKCRSCGCKYPWPRTRFLEAPCSRKIDHRMCCVAARTWSPSCDWRFHFNGVYKVATGSHKDWFQIFILSGGVSWVTTPFDSIPSIPRLWRSTCAVPTVLRVQHMFQSPAACWE